MMARSFKSVAWVAAIGAAALICYIFSLRVAEERASLAQLEAQIRRTEATIQTLKTELGTRGRVHQLQHWAAADFGFASPKANQFVEDEVRLASLDVAAEVPAMEAPVRMAAAPAPAPAASLPKPVQAAAPAPAPQRSAVRQANANADDAPAERPVLRRAASTDTATARPGAAAATAKPAAATPRPAAARTAPARPATPPRATVTRARTEAGASADRAGR
jgi:hypothetical protein